MENVIYIDELIKKMVKRWKKILIITGITTVLMTLVGGANILQERNYVYQTTFVIESSKYEDLTESLRLLISVFQSNDIMLEVAPELCDKYTYEELKSCRTISVSTNGTAVVKFIVPEEMSGDFDYELVIEYTQTALEKLTSDFQEISYVMLENPYLVSSPDDWVTELKEGLGEYILSGALVGIVAGVFIVLLMILWNPAEYKKED